MRIRHGTGSASPFDVCWTPPPAPGPVGSLRLQPGLGDRAGVLAFACLNTSTKGWDRWAEVVKLACGVVDRRIRLALRQSMVDLGTALFLPGRLRGSDRWSCAACPLDAPTPAAPPSDGVDQAEQQHAPRHRHGWFWLGPTAPRLPQRSPIRRHPRRVSDPPSTVCPPSPSAARRQQHRCHVCGMSGQDPKPGTMALGSPTGVKIVQRQV